MVAFEAGTEEDLTARDGEFERFKINLTILIPNIKDNQGTKKDGMISREKRKKSTKKTSNVQRAANTVAAKAKIYTILLIRPFSI